MSFNAIVSSYSYNLLFFTQVLTVLTSTIKYNEYLTDKGKNLTIPCLTTTTTTSSPSSASSSASSASSPSSVSPSTATTSSSTSAPSSVSSTASSSSSSVDTSSPGRTTSTSHGQQFLWVKEDNSESFHIVQNDKNLILLNMSTDDSGTYSCLIPVNKTELFSVSDPPSASDIENIGMFTIDDEKLFIINDVYFLQALTIKIKVRTVPGPVSRLAVRMSTILGVLIWDYNKTLSGGYPLKSFTVEIRPYARGDEWTEQLAEWERLDPINISPNVRYMEIYHLLPNESYEFQIWANNYIGAGEKANIIVTTLPEIGDEDLIRIIMRDAKDFDPRVWLYAVSVVMGTMVSLGLTVCLLLVRDCYLMADEPSDDDEEWDSIELIPNIILNPGFYESDDPDNPSPPYTRTIIFGEDVLSSSEDDSDTEKLSFKRKLSIFFQGDTIKRL